LSVIFHFLDTVESARNLSTNKTLIVNYAKNVHLR